MCRCAAMASTLQSMQRSRKGSLPHVARWLAHCAGNLWLSLQVVDPSGPSRFARRVLLPLGSAAVLISRVSTPVPLATSNRVV